MWQSLKSIFTSLWAPIPKVRDTGEERQLTPEMIKTIKEIQVKTNHLVNHMMAGEYVSAFKGKGMEFREVREYEPGDDIRLIEWNVTARMGHPYVKEFREEREMTMMLLVDVSCSGQFGSRQKLKNEVAAEVASIMAYAAIKNNDKVGLIIFSDQIEHFVTPQKGRSHIWRLIRTILNFKPEGRRTDITLPLEYLLRVQKKKCVAFLISDFQASGYETALRLAQQRHDLVAIEITDPREMTLPPIGLVHLEDAETGEMILVNTRDKALIMKYEKKMELERKNRKRSFRSIGVDTIHIRTDGSLINPIIQYFKMREKKH
ncbi:MAG: DUF58 domain-containing protein [Candidatus Nitronauta litoralis]|uniref:DUF58 domain-containing protein n=1 Tax=Candidatus Nitronauta litoralis TaxID=2705533 RepID=A0A7T0G1A6_9BACT|nr:MAG: DUF58 domain-containing protein [Candidatus Nitronauta litoralis]